jgi:hypothetical protein
VKTLRWTKAVLAASAAWMLPLGHGAQVLAASQAGDQQTRPALAQPDTIVAPQIQAELQKAIESAMSALYRTRQSAAYCIWPAGMRAEIMQFLTRAEALVGDALARAKSPSLTRNEAEAITDPLSQAHSALGEALDISRRSPGLGCDFFQSLAGARIAVENAAEMANRAGAGG